MLPEEIEARARRAFNAFHDGEPPCSWLMLPDGERKRWQAAAHAAASYRPPGERGRTEQMANEGVKLAQAHALIGEVMEARR